MENSEILKRSNLPASAEHLRLKDYREAASLVNYLSSDALTTDVARGTGVVLVGNSKNRLPTFTAMAKNLARMGDSVHFTSVPQLLHNMSGKEGAQPANMAKALFLTGFYCNKSDCLYSYAQRLDVVSFIEERLASSHSRMYLTLPVPLTEASKWWGSDFIDMLELRTREIQLVRI